ncbi:hypothetical protein Ddye_011542 [Dipteronia dyeriana]|uniref:NB-ARC domain-containing protein n=1 Tax=Dipteronia dyeriana TaxID=168575 RepID=A0AAE0CH52_9ROSI|nr:hypothetical protein Ddye_011542 [Dipteronia dyeriana]
MIVEMPVDKTMGMDSRLDDVWSRVVDHKVRIIGLYGTGGVGKTTLLKKLNNRFLKKTSHNFDVVIWVEVSKEVNSENIQETIRHKLDISDEIWKNKNEDERAAQITQEKICIIIRRSMGSARSIKTGSFLFGGSK